MELIPVYQFAAHHTTLLWVLFVLFSLTSFWCVIGMVLRNRRGALTTVGADYMGWRKVKFVVRKLTIETPDLVGYACHSLAFLTLALLAAAKVYVQLNNGRI